MKGLWDCLVFKLMMEADQINMLESEVVYSTDVECLYW